MLWWLSEQTEYILGMLPKFSSVSWHIEWPGLISRVEFSFRNFSSCPTPPPGWFTNAETHICLFVSPLCKKDVEANTLNRMTSKSHFVQGLYQCACRYRKKRKAGNCSKLDSLQSCHLFYKWTSWAWNPREGKCRPQQISNKDMGQRNQKTGQKWNRGNSLIRSLFWRKGLLRKFFWSWALVREALQTKSCVRVGSVYFRTAWTSYIFWLHSNKTVGSSWDNRDGEGVECAEGMSNAFWFSSVTPLSRVYWNPVHLFGVGLLYSWQKWNYGYVLQKYSFPLMEPLDSAFQDKRKTDICAGNKFVLESSAMLTYQWGKWLCSRYLYLANVENCLLHCVVIGEASEIWSVF